MKTVLMALAFSISGLLVFAQKDKTEKTALTDQQSKEILKSLSFDTTKFLRDYSTKACNCIDSISLTNKNSDDVSLEIAECIDKQVSVYQMTLKLFGSLMDPGKNNKIVINTDKKSADYQHYYFQIEK